MVEMMGRALRWGEVLEVRRRRAGLSMEELAETVGVQADALDRWERGLEIPPRNRVEQLAAALGVGGSLRDAWLRMSDPVIDLTGPEAIIDLG